MLNLENISVFYNKKRVLDNINIKINKGDFFCLVGINGSGKTTILKTIARLLDYNGTIFINEKNIKSFSLKEYSKILAFMEQVRNFDYPYKIIDVVLFSRYSYKKSIFDSFSKQDYDICENALKILGLEDKKNLLLSDISGGEQQRVFLAQIFAQNPEILVLDEPTTFLDLRYKIEILDYIKKWASENKKTVICALHELDFVLKYADKVALINDGEIITEGSPEDVIFSEKMKECYQVDISKFYKKKVF